MRRLVIHRCQGFTAIGKRCEGWANASGYCPRHAGKVPACNGREARLTALEAVEARGGLRTPAGRREGRMVRVGDILPRVLGGLGIEPRRD